MKAKKIIFEGVGTALITPFKNGNIDFECLKRLIEMQIDAGVGAIVIGGTTGEAATLEDKERYLLFEKSANFISGRVKLICGTGTNDTRAAIRHTKEAEAIGCDGVLLVTPYYNKGTSEGVYRHYESIANSTALPIILYNVPSRTGVNLEYETLKRLSEIDNTVAIKEASDSLDRLVEISTLKDSLTLYAGNDSQIYPTLSLGGLGVISVLSNLYPKQTTDICKYYFANNSVKALELQKELLPIINALFLETNPAPIKYILSKKGMCKADMRLPMWPPTKVTMQKIDAVIDAYEISRESK
jgi:4-hydroxy-tetrahydrodipicolinate synthase